jgi:IclR family KDG regulon transcriptional repressor
MLRTVNRAGRVLDLFTYEHPEWGATAVATELDIAKSQAHELLVSLAAIGLLQRGAPGRYRLGWRIVALNSLFLKTSDLGTDTVRVMRAVVDRYGETLQLAVWGPGRAICVGAWEGRRPAVSPWPIGAGLPAHSTAAGKVLLASRPSDEVTQVVAREGLVRMTERSIVSSEKLRAELAGVRRRGFAHEDEEHAVGTCAVAAPILHARRDVIAAVSMSVPAQRWRRADSEYTRALVGAASCVSRLVRDRVLTNDDGHDMPSVRKLQPTNRSAGRVRRSQ